jgi:DNA-binding HxlR family transcriptional regulator
MRHSEHICERYQMAVEIIAKRWTTLIIKQLMPGPQRFSELAAQLEVVSDRVLSERLKELEQADIISRRVIPEPPIRVEYALTEKGRALEPIISEIEAWSQTWITLETVPEAAALTFVETPHA